MELDKLEEEYLSLFIGKTVENKYTYSFYFDPQPEIDFDRDILFKFSKEHGVMNGFEKTRVDILKSEVVGNPVLINITPITSSSSLDDFLLVQKNSYKEKTGFHYRQPALVRIEVISDMQIIYSIETLLAQYGQVLALPLDISRDGQLEIRYHQKYGSIKSIRSGKNN